MLACDRGRRHAPGFGEEPHCCGGQRAARPLVLALAKAWDGVAVARGEGFPLEEIRTEVPIWHGERDRNDPIAMARAQEHRLSHVTARYYADEGHLMFFSRIPEILFGLVAR